jgi:DNA-binding FadR family transcriptional regulator
MSIEPIQRRKLAQEVEHRLLERIRAGEFRPIDQLPSERALMAHYKVGRPAIREALQSLERAGIVTITHGERARVATPTAQTLIQQIGGATRHLLQIEPGTLDHLKDARLFLERGLARRAALAASPSGVAELARCLEAHVRSIDSLGDFLGKDMAFHRQIAAMTGNPIFPAIVEGMFGWLGEYYRELVRAPGAESLTIAEHRRIFEAIAAKDPDAAEAAMHDHIARASELYRKLERPR